MASENHISKNKSDDFYLLVERTFKGDKIAFKELAYVGRAIIKTWARHEKQELKWIASNGRSAELSIISDSIIKNYLSNCQFINYEHRSFEGFRSYFIEEFRKEISVGFTEFMNLLKNNDTMAWQIVFNDLEKLSAAWFYKRNHSLKEELHSIFCESVEVVYLKLMGKEYSFSDSCAFKSFFFKILENKLFESLKNSYRNKSLALDNLDSLSLINQEPDQIVEEKEVRIILTKALLRLNQDENHILTEYFYGGKKLKEIADETGQTEENVRVRKFRALKKLFNYFKQTGYGSQGGG
jgi:RNA polymerase sigma factor (sigma-70 family)